MPVSYVFTKAPQRIREHVPSIFREWHRAHLLGIELESVEIQTGHFGEDLYHCDLRQLDRLNAFVSAYGAWRCSALPALEAETVLETLMRRPVRVRVGPNGAGRWRAVPDAL